MNIVSSPVYRCELVAKHLAVKNGRSPKIGLILLWGYLNDESLNWSDKQYFRWTEQVDRITGGEMDALLPLYKEIGTSAQKLFLSEVFGDMGIDTCEDIAALQFYYEPLLKELHRLTNDRNESEMLQFISSQVIQPRDCACQAIAGFMGALMRKDCSSFLWFGSLLSRNEGYEVLLYHFFIAQHQIDAGLIPAES